MQGGSLAAETDAPCRLGLAAARVRHDRRQRVGAALPARPPGQLEDPVDVAPYPPDLPPAVEEPDRRDALPRARDDLQPDARGEACLFVRRDPRDRRTVDDVHADSPEA